MLREKLQGIRGKENQRKLVISQLTEFNNTKQQNLLSSLYQMKQKGEVKEIHSFWILNGLHCKVLPSVAEALMQHKDIARLDYDKKRYFPPKDLDLNPGHPVTDPEQLTREDKEATIMYFLMIDRFYNGNPDNDEPVDSLMVPIRCILSPIMTKTPGQGCTEISKFETCQYIV